MTYFTSIKIPGTNLYKRLGKITLNYESVRTSLIEKTALANQIDLTKHLFDEPHRVVQQESEEIRQA